MTHLNIADFFLDARVREGRGDRTALQTDAGRLSYREVQALANRYANVLSSAGVAPEQRVIIALPDGPDYVAALFGILKIGAVVVMVNPELKPDAIEYFFEYSRATVALVQPRTCRRVPRRRAAGPPTRRSCCVVGSARLEIASRCRAGHLARTSPPTRTTRPSGCSPAAPPAGPRRRCSRIAPSSTPRSATPRQVLCYTENDVTLSVPKLYFGYATGSNLLFPFAAGASSVLFDERCTAEAIFSRIARYRPTILVTVPTMINQMVSHPEAGRQDLSSLRLATSAGEGLPEELHARWDQMLRRAASRRSRHRGDVAHLPLQSRGPGAPRDAGRGGARLRDQGGGRGRPRAARRNDRPPLGAWRLAGAGLLAAARQEPDLLPRRVGRDGRPGPAATPTATTPTAAGPTSCSRSRASGSRPRRWRAVCCCIRRWRRWRSWAWPMPAA